MIETLRKIEESSKRISEHLLEANRHAKNIRRKTIIQKLRHWAGRMLRRE